MAALLGAPACSLVVDGDRYVGDVAVDRSLSAPEIAIGPTTPRTLDDVEVRTVVESIDALATR